MEKHGCECPFEPLYSLQVETVREDLREVKERVTRLEGLLARGVLLLVANLVGVTLSLAQQLLAL